jgi:sporulation protein YlmC with PRC-barrel domain
MLVVGSNLIDKPVLSLHIGGEVARLSRAIVDPDNLKIIGYEVNGPLIRGEVGNVLLIEDVRELAPSGLIVDSIDDFVHRSDVIKIDQIMSLNFNLVGLKVETKSGQKIGKISDYTLDTGSFMVYQLVVKRPAMKALIDPELTINRSQIVEINDHKVIIKNDKEEVKVPAAKKESGEEFVPNFVNPFRKPAYEQARTKTPNESTKTE